MIYAVLFTDALLDETPEDVHVAIFWSDCALTPKRIQTELDTIVFSRLQEAGAPGLLTHLRRTRITESAAACEELPAESVIEKLPALITGARGVVDRLFKEKVN